MTPARQPQHCDRLTECQSYDEEEYPFCKDRGTPCRFHNRRRCPDYKSVIHDQVECDVRQGTHFAQQMVSDALGEPIYTRATHTSPLAPVLFQIEPNSSKYTLEQIVEINENIQKQRKEAAKAAREQVQPFIDFTKAASLKHNEMVDLMRRNNLKIDDLEDPMQKLAFTFFTEIGEMSHKAEVIIREYEESLRSKGEP